MRKLRATSLVSLTGFHIIFRTDAGYTCSHTVEGHTADGDQWKTDNGMELGDHLNSWWAVNFTDQYIITHVKMATRDFSVEGGWHFTVFEKLKALHLSGPQYQPLSVRQLIMSYFFSESWQSNLEFRIGNDPNWRNFQNNTLCHFEGPTLPPGATSTFYCQQPLIPGMYMSIQRVSIFYAHFSKGYLSYCLARLRFAHCPWVHPSVCVCVLCHLRLTRIFSVSKYTLN